MKMGTIRSPFPYDVAARHASQSAKLRHSTTLHYASRRCLRFRGVVRLPFDNGPLDQSRDWRDGPGAVISSAWAPSRTENFKYLWL